MNNLEKFNSLPGEIKIRILSYLPHKDLFTFKTLNKEYRDLINNTGFQTNIIFNSYKDFIQKIPNVLIDFVKTAAECPLDFSYSYLTLRGHPENIVVLQAELSYKNKEYLIEGINQNMRIYVKAKAVNNFKYNENNNKSQIQINNLSNTIQNLKLSENNSLFNLYKVQLSNPDFVRLLRNIKVCQRLLIREKDETHPMIDIDHIPGPEILELFSTNSLFSRNSNVNNLNNYINDDGIIDYDEINRRFTTSPMKTMLLNPEKALPILHGFLESGLVLELHNILFPVIETYEYYDNINNKDNTNDHENTNNFIRSIKRTIRLQPLKQIESFNINNITNLNTNGNKMTIASLEKFIKDLFSYISTCN